ncbi:MAG: tRNA uracil 4-sulfurtransferase ThiI [Tissierellia bacterium]|nr:tRNA uracil 4-sulfurtransferase ThiI [Tissierellia bacterium]
METVMSLSLGEVILKGKNKRQFIDKLLGQIRKSIRDFQHGKIYHLMGKIYIPYEKEEEDALISRLQHIFGIVYISPCLKVDSNLEAIEEAVLTMVKEKMDREPGLETFKAHTKRGDKSFYLNSMEVNNKIGGMVLKNFDVKVDVHHPDFYVYCDIKKDSYIYIDRYKAFGGMPAGTNGRGLLLLSGGIDSPVAGFLMAKRGVAIDCLHFHSYPFTSERGEEKVVKLAEQVSSYSGKMTFYSVNILPIQKEINKNCPEDEMTLISRRFMMRIAERLCHIKGYDSIITGESLGQVASQTIDGLKVTNDITRRLIFRPLIGMDKVNIMDLAKKIGTYETSILPFDDCCTVFLPKHPSLRPTIEEMEQSEKGLPIEQLVEDAITNMKIVKIKEEL